jgi:hypothetical protein
MRQALLAVISVLPACVGLPTRATPPPSATPEDLVASARAFAAAERWSALYDLLSARQQEDNSRLKFVIGAPSYRLRPPMDYRVVDVIKGGKLLGAIVNPKDLDRAIVYYSYSEPGKPRLDAEVEIVCEEGAWKFDGVR